MKLLLSILLWIILLSNICGQEIPYIEHLTFIDGKVKTYYAKGCKSKALYLQELLEDAITFYEEKLTNTFDLKLLVLNKKAWKYFADTPYPISQYHGHPDRIIMPVADIYKIKLPSGNELFGSNEIYFWNLIAVHELGHYISVKCNARSHTLWLSEFFADFIQIGYIIERIPDFHLPNWAFSIWTILPFKYKTLDDFENAEEIDPVNYSAYEAKFHELAYTIFRKKGWTFFNDYLSTYQELDRSLRMQEDLRIEKGYFYNYSISYLKSIDPEIFNAWFHSMRKTWHYYLIAIVLVILIAGMKFTDNSFQLLKSQGFKLKGINKIFGVSSVKILFRLKKIKNLKIKRKLYFAILSRTVMWFAFVCLFFWLIIFFIIAI